MPTILRIDGFSVRMHGPPREHGPPHVHVWKAGTEVVIELSRHGDPVMVRENNGMNAAEVRRALRIVEEFHAILVQEWRRHHG